MRRTALPPTARGNACGNAPRLASSRDLPVGGLAETGMSTPIPHHFVLTVTPEAGDSAWHARLLTVQAPFERHFSNPFELMRHLSQLPSVPGTPPPPAVPHIK